MGQKVNPVGIRLGITQKSRSNWVPEAGSSTKKFADYVKEDNLIRKIIDKVIPESAGLSAIFIERAGKNVRITLKVAKPGVIIGKKGEDVDKLRAQISAKIDCPVHINIEEIRKPELDATLVAKSIAQQLERRIMFRRAMKRAVTSAIRLGAKGIKVTVAGRLGGAEIARREKYHEGRVPLHTFRADIDYGTAIAKTTYGIIGVKVWIFKGEIIVKSEQSVQEVA